jgi:type II secretory pathway predicted ATPase ExeA
MIAPFSFKRDIPADSLFLSAQHKEAAARLKYVIQTNEFGVLTGHPGSGKTTAIRHTESCLDKNKYVFCYINESSLGPVTLYSRILDALNIKPFTYAVKLKKQFKDSVLNLYKTQNKSTVVVIDNAQALPESTVREIRYLISFNLDSFSPMSVILAGHSDLWDTLKLRSFELVFQCVTNHYRLQPLDRNQIKEYIMHQLALSECRMLFPDDVVQQIHSFTRGIPRLINKVCVNCLLDMEHHDMEIADSSVIERVINDLNC